MTDDQLLRVLDGIAAAGCAAWVAGGWGVDALVGYQTRPHRDLDLDAREEASCIDVLERLGYRIETDWRPVRAELFAARRGWVDLHSVTFDAGGGGVQAGMDGVVFEYPSHCFVTRLISGRRVPCLSVAQQLTFHSGYEPRDIDLADVALLLAIRADRPPSADRPTILT